MARAWRRPVSADLFGRRWQADGLRLRRRHDVRQAEPVIRNVVVGVVRDDVPSEQVEAALEAIRGLRVDGVDFTMLAGKDLGLREGNASFVLTADFVDESAYRAYDLDEEHNRIRSERFAPILASIQRIQFRVPDETAVT